MITILLTHYNQKKYIYIAINSVLRQDDSDWKLLICDDCSKEEEYKVLYDYVEKLADKRIKLIRNTSNLGKIATLKRLISETNSEICGLLDGDDALSPNAISVVKQAYEMDLDLGFTYSAQYMCDEWLTPRMIKNSKQINQDVNFLQAFYFTAFRTFKREIYYKNIEIEEKYTYSDDNDMAHKLEEAGKGLYIDQVLYYYRFLPHSMSHDPQRWQRAKIGHFQSMLAAMKRREGTEISSITMKEFADRIDSIRKTKRRIVLPASQRVLEFIYHYLKYHLITKKITQVQGQQVKKKPKNPFMMIFEKLFKKKFVGYPKVANLILSAKQEQISIVKSPINHFAYLDTQSGASRYLANLIIRDNWNLACNVDEDLVPDLLGYEHDGEYRIATTEISSLNDYICFAVYQDPIERFLASYGSLIKEHNNKDFMHVLNHLEYRLKNNDLHNLSLSFIPQSILMKNIEIDYLVLIDDLNSFLKNKFGLDSSFVKQEYSQFEISSQCQEKIRSIYAEDFKILDKFKDITFLS